MTGICAKQTAGVDVKRTLRAAAWTSQLGGAREPLTGVGVHFSGSPALRILSTSWSHFST
jgi:hypothetical protein